jgi:hypothetical protein
VGHVTRLGKKHTVVWWEYVKEKDHLGDLGINRITLRWILNKKDR